MLRFTRFWHGFPWNALFWLTVLALVSSAVFFAVSAEIAQRDSMRLTKGEGATLTDGGTATVALVLNGDEIVIEDKKGRRSRLRMLAIHSFDPVVNEREITAYG